MIGQFACVLRRVGERDVHRCVGVASCMYSWQEGGSNRSACVEPGASPLPTCQLYDKTGQGGIRSGSSVPSQTARRYDTSR